MEEIHEERTPPWNQQAEVAVLGSILLDTTETIMFRLAPVLKESAFYDKRNALIYRVCVALHEAAKPVTVVTIRDTILKMRSKALVEDGYLAHLVSAVGTPAHAMMYAELVNEASARREMLALAEEISGDAYGGADPTEMRTRLEAYVNEAQEKSRASEITLPSEGIAEAIQIAKDEGAGRSKHQPLKWMICPRFDAGGAVVRATDFAVVAARPGVGKTTFMLQWAKVQAQMTGRPVVFISLETPSSDLWLKIACCHAGVPEPKGGVLKPMHEEALKQAARDLDGVCQLMVLRDPPNNLWDLRNLLSMLKQKHDPAAVVIDYLGLIDVPYAKNEYEAVGKASRVMRTWARRNETAMVMVHQLNRASEKDNRPPKMHDLRGSGQIEQDATHIAFLHLEKVHEDSRRDIACILAKSRRGGAPAVQLLTLDGACSRFVARAPSAERATPE